MPTQQRDKSRISPILSERSREKPIIAFGRKIDKSNTRKSVVSGISNTEPLPNRLISHGSKINQDLDTTEENLNGAHGE